MQPPAMQCPICERTDCRRYFNQLRDERLERIRKSAMTGQPPLHELEERMDLEDNLQPKETY